MLLVQQAGLVLQVLLHLVASLERKRDSCAKSFSTTMIPIGEKLLHN